MKIERLFHVLVVAGASSTAGFGCSTDTTPGGDAGGTGATSSGTGGEDSGAGATSSGGSMGTGGSKGSGGAAGSSSAAPDAGTGDGGMCEAVCHPSTTLARWIDCNGCCCWLPVGVPASAGSPTCGEEPCCIGRGR